MLSMYGTHLNLLDPGLLLFFRELSGATTRVDVGRALYSLLGERKRHRLR